MDGGARRDLGAGRFDGAHLVKNFENGNPANTYWSKDYNLYSKIDTEEARFLEFERWWGGYFRMTGEEIEGIVNNLFVGNKLARGEVVRGDQRVDLRNITSPVVVFASWGDDITPPPQALNWIIDVWGDEKAIIEAGRTIVYMLHERIGHLGIFVGGAVARKEHDQIVNTLEQIDRLPPGLYEMVIDEKSGTGRYEDLEHGDYTVHFELRKMDDILALDPDGREDEAIFSTIAKVSVWNEAFYKSFCRPFVQAMVTKPVAEMLAAMSETRMQRLLFSDLNPFMNTGQGLGRARARQPQAGVQGQLPARPGAPHFRADRARPEGVWPQPRRRDRQVGRIRLRSARAGRGVPAGCAGRGGGAGTRGRRCRGSAPADRAVDPCRRIPGGAGAHPDRHGQRPAARSSGAAAISASTSALT